MAKKDSVRFILLGDLHYGCPQTRSLHDELEEVFIPYVMEKVEERKIDAVIQLGDFWHKRLSLNSEEALKGLEFGNGLASWLNSQEVPFYIIRGTISHDHSQLDAFDQVMEEIELFRVVKTAMDISLPHKPDFRMLFLPEEYPRDYESFYVPFIDRKGKERPDVIFGHGEIDCAISWSRASAGESHYGGTPTHTSSRLLKGTKGIVVFGHVHSRFSDTRGIYYPGSFTRWIHGEETEKGFLDITLSPVKDRWKEDVVFVENKRAKTYITLPSREICSENDPIEAIVKKVRKKSEEVDYLRVDFRDHSLSGEEAIILRNTFFRDDHVDIRMSAASSFISLDEKVEDQEIKDEETDKHAYLTDDTIEAEERLARYVNERGEVKVSVEQVKEMVAPNN